MSCRRLRQSTLYEQDYWLTFNEDFRDTPSKELRLEFLRYDSHGGPEPLDNPILVGKKRHGILGDSFKADFGKILMYFELLEWQQEKDQELRLRSLYEWFEDKVNAWRALEQSFKDRDWLR